MNIDEQATILSESIEIINSISFNWDNSCIALATNKGFKILGTQPLKLKRHRDLGASLQIVQMFDRTNLLAFVGFQSTAFSPKKVAIFDDNSNIIIADLQFESNILAIKIRISKMVIALNKRIYILNFFNFEVDHIIPTYQFSEDQAYNLISMSNDPDQLLLACPSVEKGFILVISIQNEKQKRIQAHQSVLRYVVITLSGDKVATTSQKGMHIRIFNTQSGEMLQQVRRGNEYGMIYSIHFSRGGEWLACSSDSDIVHVFSSTPSSEESKRKYQVSVKAQYTNPKSLLYFLRVLFPYFDAEYSFCHYKMNDFEPDIQAYVGFDFHDNSLLLVNDYGLFRRIELNLQGGHCNIITETSELLDLKI